MNTKMVQEKIAQGLNDLGAVVVDVSSYSSSSISPDSELTIVASHIPGKACLLTVKSFECQAFTSIQFGIIAEFKSEDWELLNLIARQDGLRSVFLRITRQSVDFESPNKDFFINHHIHHSVSEGDSHGFQSKFDSGLKFYQDCTKLFLPHLESRFTKNICLHYTPYGSDEYRLLQEKNGKYNTKNSKPYIEKVLVKLPREIFCDSQWT